MQSCTPTPAIGSYKELVEAIEGHLTPEPVSVTTLKGGDRLLVAPLGSCDREAREAVRTLIACGYVEVDEWHDGGGTYLLFSRKESE